VFDWGTGFAILLTRAESRTTVQAALPPDGLQPRALPPTPVLAWQKCGCAATEGPAACQIAAMTARWLVSEILASVSNRPTAVLRETRERTFDLALALTFIS
jgi:hypothetical protein